MILRRVAEAVREQNWFTVVIEVLIVVFGVVIGIEVSNWNEGRKSEARERELLAQLRDEVLSNNQRLQHRLVFTERVIEAGERGLEFLKQGQPCADGCQGLLVDFFHASQVWGLPSRQSVYYEMQRLGLPRSIAVKKSVDAYYNVFSGLAVTQESLPVYRKQVRYRIPMNLLGMLWRHCHKVIEGEIEVLITNCTADIGEIDASVIAYIGTTPGIYDNLNGWVGQNINATQQLPEQIKQGLAAARIIDAELGHSGDN